MGSKTLTCANNTELSVGQNKNICSTPDKPVTPNQPYEVVALAKAIILQLEESGMLMASKRLFYTQ